MFRVVFIFIVTLWACADAYKILGVFPYPGKSHHYVFDPILNELASRGHEMTIISNFPKTTPLANFTDIHIKTEKPIVFELINLKAFTPRIDGAFTFLRHFREMSMLFDISNSACQATMETPEVVNLLQSDRTFDLIILEQFNSDCAYAFTHKFKVPTVGIASHVLMSWTYTRFGLSNNPSFIPSHYLGHGLRPRFIQRVESLLVNSLYKLVFRFKSQYSDRAKIRKNIPNIPDLEMIAKNSSLLLVNSFTPLTGSRPWTSNAIEIGGVHVGNPKPLNKDLEKFIKEAKHGVVYVSLGSVLKASSMPENKLNAFLQAFAELPQRVLLKWENETLPGAPPNLLIKRWMPQIDILNHKNVKAFVSHGGMLGTMEAIHKGVPLLTIPFIGDQYANAASVRESGLGLTLSYEDITKENILEKIKQILKPEMYANAKRLSQIWNDRPISPLDTAIYWIEYVARHGGAPHLRSAAVDLPLYQYLLLDVIAFLGTIILIVLYINYKVIKLILRLCCSSKTDSSVPVKPKQKKAKRE